MKYSSMKYSSMWFNVVHAAHEHADGHTSYCQHVIHNGYLTQDAAQEKQDAESAEFERIHPFTKVIGISANFVGMMVE
jgi:hypothetical protein